ncbi:MAG TPA: PilZ domain-containing protein [Terracidiphilus sp.]|nr:PilZ domain-containing protein [Terracidiphilus sp.]
MGSGSKTWLEKFLAPSRAERHAVPDFVAYRWTGSSLRKDPVKDISTSGAYLVTDESLHPGTILSVTMQREGPLERDPERRITMQARVARRADDGVGLAFLIPKDKHSRRWESLFESLVSQLNPEDLQSFVRMHGAVEFLQRVCPRSSEELGELIQGRLSSHKVANALEIALWAESLLLPDPDAPTMVADPQSVINILEVGSSTDELWLQHCWGGLLATGCSVHGQDSSNRKYVDLFGQMMTFQARILTVVCTRATKVKSESGVFSAKPLVINIEEMVATTGSREAQMDRDLDRLAELGLIEKRDANVPTMMRSNEVSITPSRLGLELHARCNGHRGDPYVYYLNSANSAHFEIQGH